MALTGCANNSADPQTVISEDKEGERDDKMDASSKKLEPGYDTSKWLNVMDLSDNFILDIKYATTDNFVGEKMYDCQTCWLRPKVARELIRASEAFRQKGYKIKLFDCYRPVPFQQRLWDKVPDARYVTPPHKGSMHNRGMAVDLTLTNEDGEDLDMGTSFDFFGKMAYHDNYDLPKDVLQNRALLKNTLAKFGFKHIRTEWWHYSFRQGKYPLDSTLWPCD